MIIKLAKNNKLTLVQLRSAISQLTDSIYQQPISATPSATIGMHVRHILEFYQCFFEKRKNSLINYDLRERNSVLEQSVSGACEFINSVADLLEQISDDGTIQYQCCELDDEEFIDSSIGRELQFINEHTIHHMALLKLIFAYEHPSIQLDPYFGYAPSTIKHLTCAP